MSYRLCESELILSSSLVVCQFAVSIARDDDDIDIDVLLTNRAIIKLVQMEFEHRAHEIYKLD